MNKKTFLSLFLCFVLMLAGCSSDETNSQEEKEHSKSEEYIVTHAMGETTFTSIPKKVVVLDMGSLDNLLALGIKPVGAPTITLDSPFPEYLSSQTEAIENIGTVNEPNLEAITALQPDLILGSKDFHEAIYEQLKLIAPTVFVETVGTTWKENLIIQGKSLGIEDKAEDLLKDYHDRVNSYKTKNSDALANTEISILRARTDKVNAYLRQSFSGSIIEELGFQRPEGQSIDEFSIDLNDEAIPEMDGDYIIWFTRDEPNIIDTDYSKNPMWQNLSASKNNQIFQVRYDTWLSGLGIQAANSIIDDVEKLIQF